MQIGHICSNNVVTCSSNTTVLEAAQLMRRNHVGTLIVVEEVNGMLVPQGIVTDRDIVVVVLAEGLDPKSIKVIAIVAAEACTSIVTNAPTITKRMIVRNESQGTCASIPATMSPMFMAVAAS